YGDRAERPLAAGGGGLGAGAAPVRRGAQPGPCAGGPQPAPRPDPAVGGGLEGGERCGRDRSRSIACPVSDRAVCADVPDGGPSAQPVRVEPPAGDHRQPPAPSPVSADRNPARWAYLWL